LEVHVTPGVLDRPAVWFCFAGDGCAEREAVRDVAESYDEGEY